MESTPTRTDGRRLGLLISHEETLKTLYRKVNGGSEEGFENIGRLEAETRAFCDAVKEALLGENPTVGLKANEDGKYDVVDIDQNQVTGDTPLGACKKTIYSLMLLLNGKARQEENIGRGHTLLEIETGSAAYNYWRVKKEGDGYVLIYGCQKANTPFKPTTEMLPGISDENVDTYFPAGAYSWVDVRSTGPVPQGKTFNALRTLHKDGQPWVSPEGKVLQLEVKHTEKDDGSYDLDDTFSWTTFGM